MGKNFLSYFLLICAAYVAYVYIANYLDTIMQDNFTTPSVSEINKKAKDIGIPSDEYKIGVDGKGVE